MIDEEVDSLFTSLCIQPLAMVFQNLFNKFCYDAFNIIRNYWKRKVLNILN